MNTGGDFGNLKRLGQGSFDDLVAQRVSEWQMRSRMGEERPASSQGPCPVITLSREVGSGGGEIAEILASELRWDLWDRRLVDEIARTAHVRASVVQSLDEHTMSEISLIAHELMGARLLDTGYRRHLAEIILTIARHGKAVIVGRGANYLLPRALNVRVIAPLDQRAERLARREQIPVAEARKRCVACDRERADFVRHLFHRDINDPQCYDVVINTGNLNVVRVAHIIVAGVRERFGDLVAATP